MVTEAINNDIGIKLFFTVLRLMVYLLMLIFDKILLYFQKKLFAFSTRQNVFFIYSVLFENLEVISSRMNLSLFYILILYIVHGCENPWESSMRNVSYYIKVLLKLSVYLIYFFFFYLCRATSGANGIFSRRLDFSSFNVLPKQRINSYSIKVGLWLIFYQ